ncbi:MAG: 4-(cytidine 5'-diphospho)-2-C-methyl-D-erythritol kinase [Chitinophagaceae bacterium]
MIVFPNGKINLGLHITGKRPDGYHNLETVFFPVPIKDALEILPLKNGTEDVFTLTGLPVEGDASGNLCLKAIRLMRMHHPSIPLLQMHLHKVIPMGAGLGGGSADGAFTLSLLNKLFKTGLTAGQLKAYALQLGSDCPFFIDNTPSYATGRGEILQHVPLDLSAYTLVLVNPGIHVSTAMAFAGITPAPAPLSLQEIIEKPVAAWKDLLHNDFERSVFEKFPEIAGVKEQMYHSGAVYAAMSGTGSTVFGLFESTPELTLPENYLVLQLKLG